MNTKRRLNLDGNDMPITKLNLKQSRNVCCTMQGVRYRDMCIITAYAKLEICHHA